MTDKLPPSTDENTKSSKTGLTSVDYGTGGDFTVVTLYAVIQTGPMSNPSMFPLAVHTLSETSWPWLQNLMTLLSSVSEQQHLKAFAEKLNETLSNPKGS